MRVLGCVMGLLVASACSSGAERTERVEATQVRASEVERAAVATRQASAAASPPSPSPSSPPTTQYVTAKPALAQARCCALRSRLPLQAEARLGSVIAQGGQAWLLLHTSQGATTQALELWRSEGSTLSSVLTVALPHPLALAPVALVQADGSLAVATVDTQGALSLHVLSAVQAAPARILARNLDRRFAPSLALMGTSLLVAFTQTVDTAMHTFVARVRGSVLDLHDVTPTSHGAAAATFVLGADAPTLVMLDARAGVSPLLEVRFSADGLPLAAVVRTPVSQPYAPPLLAALELSNGEVEVAYTAIGRAAATAVGRVPLRRPAEPSALLPSLGYGRLAFSAALGARAGVFALESPVSAAADAPRTLTVKIVDEMGEGPALTLTGEHGNLARPSLAASTRAREFFLLYADGAGLVLSVLDCDA